MKRMILNLHQAKLILKNIHPNKSISGKGQDLDKILATKSDKPINKGKG